MDSYTTPFSITSQFAFCGLPLRLDAYRGCGFQCSYCFARIRGGNQAGEAVRPADPRTIERIMTRSLKDGRPGVIAEFLRRRVPIHFGGMSDPLQPAEEHHQVTASILRSLTCFQYPTVLSTRSALPGKHPYLDLLQELRNVVVQFSFSTTEDSRAIRVEPHATPPSILLKTMEVLSRHSVKVTCRWQPFIPGVSEAPEEFVGRVAATGCRHLAFEHLKVPVETSNTLWTSFTAETERDFFAEYKLKGARRDGRELVLPPSEKLARIHRVRSNVHHFGMTFGAADNEFQYLSDTGCCCSGVDQFEGFENWFRHQIGHAVRSGVGSQLDYSVLENEWAPTGSIDRFLNSRSRIGDHNRSHGSIRDHVRARWSRPNAPGSPLSFFGVKRKACSQTEGDRCIQYEWDAEALELLTVKD
jgi:DNA repair photolyase